MTWYNKKKEMPGDDNTGVIDKDNERKESVGKLATAFKFRIDYLAGRPYS